MIRCEDVLREISNYLDQDVTAELRRQIEEHLQARDHCHVLVDTTRKTISLVGQRKVFEIPADVSERLMTRLAAQWRKTGLPRGGIAAQNENILHLVDLCRHQTKGCTEHLKFQQ